MPTPGYATTGPTWPEGNDKITPVEEQVKTPLANYEDIINNHQVICVKYRDLFYDDDYIFKAKLLDNVIIPHATLKSRDFDQITSYRPQYQRDFEPVRCFTNLNNKNSFNKPSY